MKLRPFIPALIIVAAGFWAWHNSFHGPFIFDDVPAIVNNATIRHLWPLWQPLMPPRNISTTVQGRPIVNLSLAINYALNGFRVWGYHALNLVIHIGAGLVLFGIARRTLRQTRLQQRFGEAADMLALAIAILWVVHPLQTESVTYVVQRAESLMGLFYLLTLYGFIRGAELDALPGAGNERGVGAGGRQRAGGWYVLCVVSCLLGMGSKEVMASAPVMVFLYDRTFVAGTFVAAWKRRWRLYFALAATWVLLGYLVLSSGGRGGTAGFGTRLPWPAYAAAQFLAIMHYLRLAVWPHPLAFDYATGSVLSLAQVLPAAVVVTALLIGTIVAIWRWPAMGFLGAWFFLILAPSSSVVPVATEIIAEHRMYLSLAAVVAGVVIGAFELGRRMLARRQAMVLGYLVSGSVAALFAFLTLERNLAYRSELSIWQDTVQKQPSNARARNDLGEVFLRTGNLPEAINQFEQALRIKPDSSESHYNLGTALLQVGRVSEAITQFDNAIHIQPNSAEAHDNWGMALARQGRLEEAISHYQQALRISPDSAKVHNNLANALMRLGKVQDAVPHYEQALQIQPDLAQVHYNLGLALEKLGRTQEAVQHYQQALRIKPDFTQAQQAMARALAAL